MRVLTRDLYEGAYLLSQGMVLENIWEDPKRGRRSVIFEFVGDKVEVLRKDYQRGQALTNVLKYKSSINELKDIMFNVLRERDMRGGRDGVQRIRVAGVKGS